MEHLIEAYRALLSRTVPAGLGLELSALCYRAVLAVESALSRLRPRPAGHGSAPDRRGIRPRVYAGGCGEHT